MYKTPDPVYLTLTQRLSNFRQYRKFTMSVTLLMWYVRWEAFVLCLKQIVSTKMLSSLTATASQNVESQWRLD